MANQDEPPRRGLTGLNSDTHEAFLDRQHAAPTSRDILTPNNNADTASESDEYAAASGNGSFPGIPSAHPSDMRKRRRFLDIDEMVENDIRRHLGLSKDPTSGSGLQLIMPQLCRSLESPGIFKHHEYDPEFGARVQARWAEVQRSDAFTLRLRTNKYGKEIAEEYRSGGTPIEIREAYWDEQDRRHREYEAMLSEESDTDFSDEGQNDDDDDKSDHEADNHRR